MLCLKALDVSCEERSWCWEDVNSFEFLGFWYILNLTFVWIPSCFFPEIFPFKVFKVEKWNFLAFVAPWFYPLEVTSPTAASWGQQPRLSAGSGNASTSGRTSGSGLQGLWVQQHREYRAWQKKKAEEKCRFCSFFSCSFFFWWFFLSICCFGDYVCFFCC